MDALIDALRERNTIFNRNLTDLLLDEILKTDLQLLPYIPHAGLKFPELPHFLVQKQTIINVKNTDNRFFGFAVLSALHLRAKNPQHPLWNDRFFAKAGLDQIHYAVSHEQIPANEDKLKTCIIHFTYWDDEANSRTAVYISIKLYPNPIGLL